MRFSMARSTIRLELVIYFLVLAWNASLISSPAPRTSRLALGPAILLAPHSLGNPTSGLTSASTDIPLGAGRGLSRFLRKRGTWGRFRFLAFPTRSRQPSDISYSRERSLTALAGNAAAAGRPESESWRFVVWSVGPAAAERSRASSPRVAPAMGTEKRLRHSEGLAASAAAAPGTRRSWAGAEPRRPQPLSQAPPSSASLVLPLARAPAAASAFGSNLTVFEREF